MTYTQNMFLFYYYFLCWHYYKQPPFPPMPLCCPPPSPYPPPSAFTTLLSMFMGYAHMNICSLANLFQSPPPPSLLRSVSLLHVSTPLVLFCSSVYFVHLIPHMIESILYLSFSDRLISLSITISRFICAVVKGKSSFFVVVM